MYGYTEQETTKALQALLPLGGYSTTLETLVIEEDGIEFGYTKPSKSQFIAAIEKIKRLEYRDKRAEEYPKLGEQLGVLWKQLAQFKEQGQPLVAEANIMLGKLTAVKNKYPKGV